MGSLNFAVVIDHLLDIAMIRSYQHFSANALQGSYNLLHGGVNRFNGLDSCGNNSSMADHVGIGIIAYDDIVFAACDSINEAVSDFRQAHFRL